MGRGPFEGEDVDAAPKVDDQDAAARDASGILENDLEEAMSVRVEGIARHYRVAITQPHPGWFAYHSQLQPYLFRLFIECLVLVHLAKAYACQTSNWGKQDAKAVVATIIAQSATLRVYMNGLKTKIKDYLTLICSAALLSKGTSTCISHQSLCPY